MRRSLVLLVAVVTGIVAPAAAADPPERFPAPTPELITGSFCEDFDVALRLTTNSETATIFSNGSVIITGALKGTLENVETGKTINVNFSGPVFVPPAGTPLVLRGNTLLFGEAGDLGPGMPATLLLVSGVVEVTFDAAGNPTRVTTQGKVRDLCVELAS